jgi:hypothetical protein
MGVRFSYPLCPLPGRLGGLFSIGRPAGFSTGVTPEGAPARCFRRAHEVRELGYGDNESVPWQVGTVIQYRCPHCVLVKPSGTPPARKQARGQVLPTGECQ